MHVGLLGTIDFILCWSELVVISKFALAWINFDCMESDIPSNNERLKTEPLTTVLVEELKKLHIIGWVVAVAHKEEG